MSELLDQLKDLFVRSKGRKGEWKAYYPNNLKQNGEKGRFIEFWFRSNEGRWLYSKYTILYQYAGDRCCEDDATKYRLRSILSPQRPSQHEVNACTGIS